MSWKDSLRDGAKNAIDDRVSNLTRSFLGLNGGSGTSYRAEAEAFTSTETKQARLGPSDEIFAGDNAQALQQLFGPNYDDPNLNLLGILYRTRGIIFPYTPDVQFGKSASYDPFHFTHSNYPYHQYAKSAPTEIQITAPFTAQTNEEGHYLAAALRFLSASSMMEFGKLAKSREVAGTPPPVLRFNYLGDYMFSNVPVIITNFSYMLEKDVDYVGIQLPPGIGADITNGATAGNISKGQVSGPSTYVPTRLILTVQLQVQQNPKRVREEFDLAAFKQGQLVKKGFI